MAPLTASLPALGALVAAWVAGARRPGPAPGRPPVGPSGRRGPWPGRGSTPDRGARWAGPRDLAPLVVRGPVPPAGRLVLGRRAVRGRRGALLAGEPAQSLAVVGPTQSGKTTAVAIPAILGWEGPVVAASVKGDLLADTRAWRAQCGHVWVFDPTGATGVPGAAWSPLRGARTWAGARRVAADLTEVTRGAGTTADGEFWYATAAKLLAPLLLAAATGGRSMADVIRWVDTQDTREVAELLEAAGVPEARQAVEASWLRDERQRSGVYTTAETVLEPFVDLVAAGGSGPAGADPIEPEALLDRPNTLYLCAPAHDQRRLRGLFVALLQQVVDTAFRRATRQGRPLDPPLLVVLDEAAHIAPLAELDGLAATCAGHGVQLVTVWQDLAQMAARYGPRAATVLNNHRARLFLPGIAEPETLRQASLLVGDEEVRWPSVTRDRQGRSTTESTRERRLLPPEDLRRLAAGSALLVYGALPPAHLALRPWWTVPELARRRSADEPAAGPRPGLTGTVRPSGTR